MVTRARKAPARKSAEKSKGGRPSKWKPEYLDQVYKLCLLGLTDKEIAAVWSITERTFNDWKTSIPGFLQSIARGKQIADAEVAASLFERATGYSHPEIVLTSYKGDVTQTEVTRHYPPDTQAASIWLRNRRVTSWRSNPDPTDGSDDPPPPAKVVIEVVDGRRPRADAKAQPAAG